MYTLNLCSKWIQDGHYKDNCKIKPRNCLLILRPQNHAKLRPLLATSLLPANLRLLPGHEHALDVRLARREYQICG